MVSGLSAAELEAGDDGATPSVALRPVLRGIGLFVAGFTLVFVALGATASGVGHVLKSNKVELAHISGIMIIALGVVMVLTALPARVWAHAGSGTLGVVSRVTGEHRFDVRPSKLGSWAAPVMGMAFAFAWTPCVGPVLTRHWLWAVELGAGVLLVGFGVLLLTDNIGWVSNHVSSWLNDVGLGRLTTS